MYRILIAEDDPALARELKREIEPWGYEVRLAEDFSDLLGEFTRFDPHLVLMDVMLPFFNGYHWCAEIRRVSSVPVVFLSSAADNMNIVLAMNMGGDDFIAKPADPHVLSAKLGAILRRAYGMAAAAPMPECRGAVLNVGDCSLTWEGKRLELTRNETRILQELMEKRGQVVSRDTLMLRLWQDDRYVEENTLTVNVTRLRKKLEAAGLENFITTRVGSGYMIE